MNVISPEIRRALRRDLQVLHEYRDDRARVFAALKNIVRIADGRDPETLSRNEVFDIADDIVGHIEDTTPQPSRMQTCFHEAGHAVVGTLLGLPISKVKVHKIRSDGDSFGRTDYDPLLVKRAFRSNQYLLKAIIQTIAGAAAEMAYAERRIFGDIGEEDAFFAGLGSDNKQIARMAAVLGKGQRERVAHLIHQSRLAAEYLVGVHRFDIERVARALCDRGELRGSELRRLMRPARQHVPMRYLRPQVA